MLWRSPRRLVSVFRFAVLRYLPVWRWVLLVFSVWTCLECLYIHHYLYLAEQTHRVQLKPKSPVRVYIASIHWNNERILRESWNQAFLDLVSALGPKNVFVSVYESGSRDGSKDALLELDKALEVMGAPRNVTLDNATHADAIASPPSEPGNGCVKTSRGQMELRRIPYLARLRNISLQPLKDMALGGTAFDYVLFLNDVVFTVCSVLFLTVWFEVVGRQHIVIFQRLIRIRLLMSLPSSTPTTVNMPRRVRWIIAGHPNSTIPSHLEIPVAMNARRKRGRTFDHPSQEKPSNRANLSRCPPAGTAWVRSCCLDDFSFGS